MTSRPRRTRLSLHRPGPLGPAALLSTLTGQACRRPWIAAIVAALVMAACFQPAHALSLPWSRAPEAPAERPRPVVSMVLSDSMTEDISIPGEIRARIEVDLAFQTLGRMTARNVDVGDVVRRGQVLAMLDPEDLQDQVRAAEAALAAAEVELRTARATAERTRALASRNVATTAQLEQAERLLATAEAAREQARSQLIRARDAETFAEMTAPFDGVISAVMANPGTVVNAGEPVMQLAGHADLEAVIDVQPAQLARLEPGDAFEIWSENHPEERHLARVARIEPMADAATRTRRVRLALGHDQGFRLGALVRAQPATRDMRRLAIPASAVLERDGRTCVWVVTREGATGHVSLREVRLAGPGPRDTMMVESGLEAGDEVVIRGIHSLTEGQLVGKGVTP